MNEDPDLKVLKTNWKLLSEKQKRSIYYQFCFGLWREGHGVPVPWIELLLGAWFSFTEPIEKVWLSLDVEERAVLIAGMLIGLLCILQLISKVG